MKRRYKIISSILVLVFVTTISFSIGWLSSNVYQELNYRKSSSGVILGIEKCKMVAATVNLDKEYESFSQKIDSTQKFTQNEAWDMWTLQKQELQDKLYSDCLNELK